MTATESDLDELTAEAVALDVSVILDDFEPPAFSGPSFAYQSSGAPGESGDGWFLMQVMRNDGRVAWFRVTVEALDTNWGED
jgi:hypothetical protein